MAINKITIENFKAFKAREEIRLAPLTVLIGCNSSGKSSIVHALACLKQTAVRKTSGRALVLDGTDVLVNLGRYVDAVHGHDYKRQIGLGLSFDITIQNYDGDGVGTVESGEISYTWKFAGTKKTQRVRLATRTTDLFGTSFAVRGKVHGADFTAHRDGSQIDASVLELQNLSYRVQPIIQSPEPDFSEFFRWQALNTADSNMLRELEAVRYLGPFREPPRRLYPYHGPVTEVGRSGDLAVPMLVAEFTASSRSRPRSDRVEQWLRDLGLGAGLELKRQGASDSFRVSIRGPQGQVDLTPADVGYGVSQVLPVLVQAGFAEEGDTLLFEQPELHLHPTAQRALGSVFVETMKRTGSRIVIETHSRNLVGAFQHALRAGDIELDDLTVILIEAGEDGPTLHTYRGDDEGSLWDDWDQSFPEPWDAGPEHR